MSDSNRVGPSIRQNNSKEFPDFLLRRKRGNPDFVKIVEKELDGFEFLSLPKHEAELFKLLKKVGLDSLLIASFLTGNISGLNSFNTYTHYLLMNAIGTYVYQKVTSDIHLKYYPDNYVSFYPYRDGSKILVQFDSLLRGQMRGQTFFYSKLKPRIKIEGKKYIVAFTQHMIDRVYERTAIDQKNYTSLGDIFSLLAAYNPHHLELCTLNNGQPAISFWGPCGKPPFWHSHYIPYVLGKLVPGGGDALFRLGYSPIVLHDDFAVAKTLLYPGYKSTPEYALLQSSSFSKYEKEEMQNKSTNQDALRVVKDLDFSCIKWFHDNGITQVKQSRHELFNHMDLAPTFYREQFGLA
ncbi:MAG: hypothetical protein KME47_25695 [Nodosilinea sp. WJT8-NPBG4]|nr:hypothetical protein [Nodosilinea sp. WJT8-NPBG4]